MAEANNAARATLGELAVLVGGTVEGDPTVSILGAWPPEDCEPSSITLVDHQDRVGKLTDCPAAAVVLPRDVETIDRPAIRVDNVHAAFAAIVQRLRPNNACRVAGVSPSVYVPPTAQIGRDVAIGHGAVIGEGAVIGDHATIGPGCVIGDACHIGDDSWLAARVTLYADTVLGERCRLHSGVVLGADGFGYRNEAGRHVRAPQLGMVIVGDDVEIGANTCVDRGVYGPTRIGDGTKIDNLVQIGHNCRIGRHNLLCSQVGIAGSTTTGDYVVMAGQVGVRDHVHIGKGAVLSAMAGVSNDVADGEIMLGVPATPLREQKLRFAAISKLPALRKEFRDLKRQVAELQERLAEPGAEARRAA